MNSLNNKLRLGVNSFKKLNKNQSFKIISKSVTSSSYLSINNNTNNHNKNIYKFYTTETPITPPDNNKNKNEKSTPIPPTLQKNTILNYFNFFSDFNTDKGNGTLGNIVLNIAGLTIILTSIGSLIFYFFDNENKSSRDDYLFRVLSYFSSFPPFDLMEKKGYISSLVQEYKDGTITPAGLKVIGLILALNGHDYLLKYDMFDIVCDKLIAKKDVLIPRTDPDFFILCRLAFHSPKSVPNEIVQRTEKDSIFRLLEKKDQVLTSLQPEKIERMLKVEKTDFLVNILVAAPLVTFLLFKNKISPPFLFKSMQRSVVVSGLVMGGPIIKDAMNKRLFKDCDNFTCHALKSQIPTIFYGATLVYCSYYPFISWFLPILSTLIVTKTYSLYSLSRSIALSNKQNASTNSIIGFNDSNNNKKNKMD